MKNFILAFVLLPWLAAAQVHTKITYNIPKGFKPGAVALYTADQDAPVWQGKPTVGRHTIIVNTKGVTTGFIYVTATRQFLSFTLTGAAKDLSGQLTIPRPGEEDMFGSAPDVFPGVDKNFLEVTSSIQNVAVLPQPIVDTTQAKYKAQQYYSLLQHLVAFTDSVVTRYPKNNVSLFTIFRLSRWCAYSPDIYNMLDKLDTSLRNNDFANQLMQRKAKMDKDSVAVAGKKTSGILQKALTGGKIKGAGASKRVLVFWDDYSRPDKETIDDVKRLHLVFNNSQLQINFVYTGSTGDWQAMVKQNELPSFANYLRCSKPDQLGTGLVVTDNANTGLLAGIKGYYLYEKIVD